MRMLGSNPNGRGKGFLSRLTPANVARAKNELFLDGLVSCMINTFQTLTKIVKNN